MPAQDPYLNAAPAAAGPATRLFAVTPSDTAELPFVTTGLYVGSGGDVAVQDRLSGETVVFRNVGEGAGLPVRVARVLATGTTAGQIVGLA
ncbi:hypothetical protein D3218_04335 [Aureimonas flava]|uniref:Uncharacterized protein n=1 Tax=Aureimonas flava TaxID=2320271 RepID=A0A3A1WNE5_9HYPH|nr:hypothetical protein [Aureimonas flava]RIY02599.1 hypothetical protein D3218_04335 [Aureimonas flava]